MSRNIRISDLHETWSAEEINVLLGNGYIPVALRYDSGGMKKDAYKMSVPSLKDGFTKEVREQVSNWESVTNLIEWSILYSHFQDSKVTFRYNATLRLMIATFYIRPYSAISADTLIGTINANFRPSSNIHVPFATNNEYGQLLIDTSGRVSVSKSTTAAYPIVAQAVYNLP